MKQIYLSDKSHTRQPIGLHDSFFDLPHAREISKKNSISLRQARKVKAGKISLEEAVEKSSKK
jgi:hypothetical protein